MSYPIIGISGYAETGKSLLTKFLEEDFLFFRSEHVKTPICDMAETLLYNMGIHDRDEIYERLWASRKNEEIPGFPGISGRLIMQALGREFKLAIDPTGLFFLNLWLDKAEKEANGNTIINESVRYPEEAAYIRSKGGIIIQITRPGKGPLNPAYEPEIPGDIVIDNSFPTPDALRRHVWTHFNHSA